MRLILEHRDETGITGTENGTAIEEEIGVLTAGGEATIITMRGKRGLGALVREIEMNGIGEIGPQG